MQARKSSVRRPPVQVSPPAETSRGHSKHPPPVSDIDSHSEGSPRLGTEQLLKVPTWDGVSQVSTAPATANTSSVGSPPLGQHTRSASYSTAATAPSLIDTSRVKKLAPLHEHLEIIRTYKQGLTVTEVWTVSTSRFNADVDRADSKESSEKDEHKDTWKFWERMVNTADALATARYLNDAFDIYHRCLLEMFEDTGQRLAPLNSAAPAAGQHNRDQKASKFIASSLPLLQILNRAVIGAARSCTTPGHSKMARVMLDAAHCVLRQIKNTTQVRALLILFDIYRNTLIELWHDPNTTDSKLSDPCEILSTYPKSSRLNQEYSLDDLVRYIPPAILNREYFVLSTHLLNLSRYQKSWLSLPANATAWERPLAEFVRNMAIPSKTSLAWFRLVTTRSPPDSSEFIEAYLKESKAFLHWCTNAIFEERTRLDTSLADRPLSSHVVARDSLNDARLALYWFFVSRRKSLDYHTTGVDFAAARGLPKFPHSDNSASTFDAFWVLSSFIFGFCTPESVPTSFRSVSEYALVKISQILKWPYGFVWHYLRQTVSLASKLHVDGEFVQDDVERKQIELAILGPKQTGTPDSSPQMAAELHPQPLPEFINSPEPKLNMSPVRLSKYHMRSPSKVTFAESAETQSTPTKSPRRRWLQRLSLSSTSSSGTIPMSGFKSSMTKSKTNSPRSSTGDRSARQSVDTTAASAGLGLDRLDDFPGDYTAITADLLASTSSYPIINGAPPTPPAESNVTARTPPFDADKVGTVVQSTEILLPEIRPPFVVLH
ncbi:hypothetical protein H2200_011899 [Cladophialophora chaetospira]|uniref:Uncharacterized protein n=1 Tax=Cladophialophora chaetospira TaxID=386627 RepID=A0AA39CCY2_9EURO|nr:hypothetical protein H2200_011899 [Cladophialophora chaetospira]